MLLLKGSSLVAVALLWAVAPLSRLDAQSMELRTEFSVARRQAAPSLATLELPEERLEVERVVNHAPEFIVGPRQSAPSLVPTPERPMDQRGGVAVLNLMRGTPWAQTPEQSSGRVKWALIGGVTGATIGYLAWFASFSGKDAPGAGIFLPAYVASGTLLGAVIGAVAAR